MRNLDKIGEPMLVFQFGAQIEEKKREIRERRRKEIREERTIDPCLCACEPYRY